MALTLDPATKVISVPQGDLTLVSGTLYDMDTDQFRKDVFDLLSSENYIWMDDAYTHNTQVTVAGVTYARTLEFINGYSVQFTPDSQWTVRLNGSNNNIFDVQNSILVQNQVQVIPTNSAGLQQVTSGSGVLPSDVTDIRNEIFNFVMEGSETFAHQIRMLRSESAGDVEKIGNLYYFKSADGGKTRFKSEGIGDNGEDGRTITDPDGT